MGRKVKLVKVADLFCGAGSLSMGANDALIDLGYKPQFVAVNHWDIATQTYARNHPGASVHCVTLDAAFPMDLVPAGYLDLLMAGIECTYFSRARGGKPVNDQQRMSAWHVVRWCTELDVKRLLLENVPEFVDWGPVDPATGKPIKERKGEYFRAWVEALRAIGFKLEWRVLNCADYGDATTRRRLFMLADRTRPAVLWPKASHGKLANGVAAWRGADQIIDWSIKGNSIFNRKRPLAAKTLARIAAGITKFGWPEPFIVVLRQHADARGIELPLPAVTAGGKHFGLVEPFVIANRENNVGRALTDPMPGATTAHGGGIAVVEPFVLSPNSNGAPRRAKSPLPTITLGGAGNEKRPGCARHAVIQPFVLSQHAGGAPRSAGQPIPGMTNDGAHALIAPYYGSGSGKTCRSTKQPLPAATAKARFGLVMPVTHNDKSNRARQVKDPLPTLTTAKRGELAFITASFGERPTQSPRVHSIKSPAPVICAQGRTNLVEAGEHYDILFRMLEPHELAAAMSISTAEKPYHFVGNKTQVVRQIGQAVPRRTGRALARALMGGDE